MEIDSYSGKDFGEFCGILNNVIDNISKYPIKVLYGFKWNSGGGVFVDLLFRQVFNIKVDYIIDDDIYSYRQPIYKLNLLDYLDNRKTCIIDVTSVDGDNFENLGYKENENYFNICKLFQLKVVGYIEYLEKKYDLDITSRNASVDVEKINKDFVKYGPSRSLSIPFLCQYLRDNHSQKNVLDLGCGKAGAMIVFKDFGYSTVDGVEYLDELATIGEENLKRYGKSNNSRIFCEDVTSFKNFDEYDLIYIYDAFRGETFLRVRQELERSQKSNPRPMIVVYPNPFEHKLMIKDNTFKLVKQLEGDWLSRFVNIYEYSK